MHRVTIPFRLCSLMHASLPPPSRKTCQMALPWPCTLLLCHNHPPAGTALGRTTRSKHKPIQTKSNSKEHTASKGRWKLGEWGEGSYRRCGGGPGAGCIIGTWDGLGRSHRPDERTSTNQLLRKMHHQKRAPKKSMLQERSCQR